MGKPKPAKSKSKSVQSKPAKSKSKSVQTKPAKPEKVFVKKPVHIWVPTVKPPTQFVHQPTNTATSTKTTKKKQPATTTSTKITKKKQPTTSAKITKKKLAAIAKKLPSATTVTPAAEKK
jgi:hypothetical protein